MLEADLMGYSMYAYILCILCICRSMWYVNIGMFTLYKCV